MPWQVALSGSAAPFGEASMLQGATWQPQQKHTNTCKKTFTRLHCHFQNSIHISINIYIYIVETA